MTDRYDELRAAAEAATPGPWRQSRTRRFIGNGYGAPWVCEMQIKDNRFEANSAFIALANPETIEALLSERDSQRETLKNIQEWADEAINNGGVIVMTRRCEDISDATRAALTTKEG